MNHGESPFFSVVIPTCGRLQLLTKCLEALTPGTQTIAPSAYEVIVSDDGPDDQSAETLTREKFPWVRWISGPRKGPAANRNCGAGFARGKWLVFTDDDCLPDENFLSGYFETAKAANVMVLEGRTIPAGIRTRVDMECPANEKGGYLWSCNMAVRKELFFEMGGFDTNFPGPAMEDVDFRTRLVRGNISIVFVPQALVSHPWRRKKGFGFVHLHTKSLRYYAAKHSKGVPSMGFIIADVARKLLKQIPPAAWRCRGKGLVREVLLTFYTAYALIIYSRKS